MKNFFLIGILALTAVACDKQDKFSDLPRSNTDINAQNNNATTPTPSNQYESESDRVITQKIRLALMSDNSLSTNAKNIKIITINGAVTLKGSVFSPQEKELLSQKAAAVQGVVSVDNQLDVTGNKY